MVKLEHPDLDQTIEVPESAVPIHMASGWRPVEDAPAQSPAEDSAPRTVSRRTNKED